MMDQVILNRKKDKSNTKQTFLHVNVDALCSSHADGRETNWGSEYSHVGVWGLDLASCGTLSKPRLVTHLSLYQLFFFLWIWRRVAVGGRDGSSEGTGRGEEETDRYIKEPTLAHEEKTRGAQVKTKTQKTASHILCLLAYDYCNFCFLFFMLVLFWYFAC